MKPRWKSACIGPNDSILRAIRIIDSAVTQCALVTRYGGGLAGVVTDGDIRRAILAGVDLHQPIKRIMNRNFLSLPEAAPRERILEFMLEKKVRRLPLLDGAGRIRDLVFLETLVERNRRDNWVVIMAGGLGTRLRPLTDHLPKPMVRVGKQPLLATILDSFAMQGFYKFFISVNYKSEIIKEYFGDGSDRGVEIRYLEEKRRLGSAGALSLLPARPKEPVLVINADLLTNVNFGALLDYHSEQDCWATMCVKEYDFQVPYGVIKTRENRLIDIDEKPVHHFFVNAGIYVLNPEVLGHIPRASRFDMTSLFEKFRKSKSGVGVFPIREYWLDIGRKQDLAQAQDEYEKVFG